MVFQNREEAGQKLAQKIKCLPKSVVLALPRGGLPVGFQIALKCKVPLDLIISRKLSSTNNPELGFGALSEMETLYIDPEMVSLAQVSEEEIEESLKREKTELKRRIKVYRHGKKLGYLKGKNIILVDDGIATGVTIIAAIKALHKIKVAKIILAVPVCAKEMSFKLKALVDEFVCLEEVKNLGSIGSWYRDFVQQSDQDVLNYLKYFQKR